MSRAGISFAPIVFDPAKRKGASGAAFAGKVVASMREISLHFTTTGVLVPLRMTHEPSVAPEISPRITLPSVSSINAGRAGQARKNKANARIDPGLAKLRIRMQELTATRQRKSMVSCFERLEQSR